MRRFLFLIFAILLLLSACGQTTKQETQAAPPQKEKLVPTPMTWEMIDAVPIATADMTEEELRQICIDFFRLQLLFQWTPKEDLDLEVTGYKRDSHFPAGQLYAGFPYMCSNSGRMVGNLYIAMDYYDSETGLLDNTVMDDQSFVERFGNNCSSGAFWGWARVVNSVTNHACSTATLTFGFIPVGPYDAGGSMYWNVETSTDSICALNGPQMMFESYAAMKPADGLVNHHGKSGNAHMRMVSREVVVKRLPDGTIDGENSYVTYLDQSSILYNPTIDGQPFVRQGGLDIQISFQTLFDSGYLPFTFGELIGEDPVEPAEIQLSGDISSGSAAVMFRTGLTCNYSISHLTLTVQDKNGKEVYKHAYYPKENNVRQVQLAALIRTDEIAPYLDSDHTVTITCRVSTGQLLTVYSGNLSA